MPYNLLVCVCNVLLPLHSLVSCGDGSLIILLLLASRLPLRHPGEEKPRDVTEVLCRGSVAVPLFLFFVSFGTGSPHGAQVDLDLMALLL